MKIKRYKDFLENATASASTAGAGAVSSAQPGSPAGTTGTTGSGDLGFVFKKEKRKKGKPNEVTDMRDLAPAKGITKVDDIKESVESDSRNPKHNLELKSMINDCLVELYDLDFELNSIDYDKDREWFDTNEDEQGFFDWEELRISLHKLVEKKWTGNITIRNKFNKEETFEKRISTLRSSGSELTNDEKEIEEMVDDAAHRLINLLGYKDGYYDIQWLVAGSATPWNTTRNTNINVHIILKNMLQYDE